ncbi:MAG: TM2 domain-containing protein [Gorillibacterium sp.]|nr:TM2 domain-containing protein [Gorillibacterium sp.]
MTTKNDLSLKELLVLNSEARSMEKSLALCYMMLLGGHLGIHRFYLKRYKSAVTQLLLFLLAMSSYITSLIFTELDENNALFIVFIILFIITALALTIWVIIDLFIVPKYIRQWNAQVESDLINQIVQMRQ